MDKTPKKYLPQKDLHAKVSEFVQLKVAPKDYELSEDQKIEKFTTKVMCTDNPKAVILNLLFFNITQIKDILSVNFTPFGIYSEVNERYKIKNYNGEAVAENFKYKYKSHTGG